MSFATGARHGLSFVGETVFGTTPATPTMKRLRNTGTTLNLTKQAFTSDEIRSDRQISDSRHGNRQVGGDINFELSYGAFDDWLAAALFGTWATDQLKVGTDLQSFTVERQFTDVGQYLRYLGCAVNQLKLNIRPNAMVTGSFSVTGKDMETDTTSLGAATDVATNPPFDAFSGVLKEGGATIGTVTSIDLTLDNGLDPAFVIGSDTTPQLIAGRSNLTGTLAAYFETRALLDKFINEEESSIELTLEGAAGGDLKIEIPRVKYSGGDLPVNGEGAVTMNMPFQALFDATAVSNLVLTRIPA